MLKLAKELDLPLTAITQTFAMLGKRGGGKSYCATKLAELMLEAGAQIIALDPVGVWYGLRVPKNKKDKAFNLVVFGGFNGDIEINPKAGKIIAEIIIERNLSAVIDFSHFIQSEQTRFAYDFLTTVFELKKKKPSPVHVFLEEAQEVVPQNIVRQPGENYAGRVLHAGERMVKLGRNFGIGCSLISQRPQEVNKKVLNQTEVMLAFQMTGIQERKTIAEWTQDKGSREEMVAQLPALEVGEALVWSPSWLKFDGKVKILPKKTADVSATPQLGDNFEEPRKLAPVDVEELAAQIHKLSEDAEKDSPKILKKRIAELEERLSKNGNNIPQNSQTAFIEKETALNAREKQLSERENALQDFEQQVYVKINKVFEEANRLVESRFTQLKTELAGVFKLPERIKIEEKLVSAPPIAKSVVREEKINPPAQTNGTLPKAQQKVLDTLATLEKMSIFEMKKAVVAALAGYSPDSGSFNGSLAVLRADELIEYLPETKIKLTDKGWKLANPEVNTIFTNEDLHQIWYQKLKTPGKTSILRLLIEHYPKAVAKTAIAEETGYSASSGSFNGSLADLRAIGLIDYRHVDGEAGAFATDILFPFDK